MSTSKRLLYSVAQARAIDRRAIEQFGIPGFELMRRAGEAAARQILQRYPLADHNPALDYSAVGVVGWLEDRFAGRPSASNCG